jgi:metacaspase-1
MSVRKALLVGINAYPGAPLRGCINDVQQMKGLLQQYCGFQDDGIKLLIDGDATAAGIRNGLAWLAEGGAGADAVRVFHYSGHGTYVADQNGDEPDGRDECLVPYDYKSVGFITDDVLKTLYDRFPTGSSLTLVMDSCHSGSVNKAPEEDIVFRFLPVSDAEQEKIDAAAARFVQDQQEYVFKELKQLRGQDLTDDQLREKVGQLMASFERKRFGNVHTSETNVLLAGCRPDQTAADAKIAGDYHGAFTYYLAEAIQQASGRITYRQLAQRVGEKLKSGRFSQIPQLEHAGQRDQSPIFQPFGSYS